MSLEDELNKARVLALTTDEWVSGWVSTIPVDDQKVWQAWLDDPRKPAAVMFRVARSHGYLGNESSFRHWVKEHRDALAGR